MQRYLLDLSTRCVSEPDFDLLITDRLLFDMDNGENPVLLRLRSKLFDWSICIWDCDYN